MERNALVLGAGGFIGSHLVKRLHREGFWVRGVDLKAPEFRETAAHDFVIGDLREPAFCRSVIDRRFDEVYQLAADMGGAGYLFTGEHDADVMHNSAAINLNVLDACRRRNVKRVFFGRCAMVLLRFAAAAAFFTLALAAFLRFVAMATSFSSRIGRRSVR